MYTYLASNPRFGPYKSMVVLRFLEIMVGVIFFHITSGVMNCSSGVEGGVPWALRWITCRRRAALGHNSGSPDALCPIFLSDSVILGHERQCDEICSLEISFSKCGRKYAMDADRGGFFKAGQGAL